jgi:uncharacterized membrane protein YsdA (DUF1294 family)
MGTRGSWLRNPQRFHAALALLLAALLALALLIPFRHSFTWYHLLGAWLLAINVTTFAYYGFDKKQAKGAGRRIPENVLHLLALSGGSLGAWLAMRVFRHKTIKGSFRLVFWLIVALQLVLVGWVATLLWHHHW